MFGLRLISQPREGDHGGPRQACSASAQLTFHWPEQVLGQADTGEQGGTTLSCGETSLWKQSCSLTQGVSVHKAEGQRWAGSGPVVSTEARAQCSSFIQRIVSHHQTPDCAACSPGAGWPVLHPHVGLDPPEPITQKADPEPTRSVGPRPLRVAQMWP